MTLVYCCPHHGWTTKLGAALCEARQEGREEWELDEVRASVLKRHVPARLTGGLRDEIVEVLASDAWPQSLDDLARATDTPRKEVQAELHALIDAGRVQRLSGRGTIPPRFALRRGG